MTFHADVAGFSNNSGKIEIVVSPDGGTTWFYGGEITTGNHYNTFNVTLNKELAVANCDNVIVRLIVGNDKISRSDWRVKNISITGEPIGNSTIHTISATADNSSNGYVQINPIGNKFADGSNVSVQSIATDGHQFSYWTNNNNNRFTDNPYNFIATNDIASLTAHFKSPSTIAEWTFATTDFKNSNNKKQDYPADTYVDESHKGIFSVYDPSGKAEWYNIAATEKQIIGTTTNLNLNGVRRAYKFWSDSGFNSPCYAQIEISTVGYANIQIKSYLESWTNSAYATQKLQYSTDGETFTDLASVDFTQTQRWHPLNGGGVTAMANQATLYIRWTYDMTGSTLSGSALTGNESEDVRIGGIVITGDPLVELNENSNYTAVAEANASIHLTRTITAGNWSTIVLPFDMTAEQVTATFGEGTKLATVGEYNSSTKELTTTTATTIAANIPCFIKVPSNFTSATISGVTIKTGTPEATISGDFKFAGTYEKIENLASGNYYVKNNSLFKATGTQTIKPFRAYFTGVPANARLMFFDDNTTRIKTLDNFTISQFDNDAPIFNLAGQRVGKNYKGVVIQNGKKYIQK